jgi:hypothetical protein
MPFLRAEVQNAKGSPRRDAAFYVRFTKSTSGSRTMEQKHYVVSSYNRQGVVLPRSARFKEPKFINATKSERSFY